MARYGDEIEKGDEVANSAALKAFRDSSGLRAALEKFELPFNDYQRTALLLS